MKVMYVTFRKDGYTYCVDLQNEIVDCIKGPATSLLCLEGLVSTGNIGGAEIWKKESNNVR
jgi:hypothetical protein